MKRYLLFVPALLFILSSCSKSEKKQDVVIPPTPEITIQNITYPTFTNSTWTNVAGGKVIIQFDNTDAGGAVLSTVKDSTDIANIASYDKVLKKGTYDITLTSKGTNAVADTFIRFSAQIKGYNVDSKQAVSLTATTTDGLITISQGFIQPNKIPVFKAQADGKEYKMGMKNGFYYIYVNNGVKGDIVFTEAVTGQSVSKNTSVVALNQYNVSVSTISGVLQIFFTTFNYVNVTAETNTLATINVDPGDYYFSHTTSAYFVATDENGIIINQTKYVPGTTKFKLLSTVPYAGSRFNLFVILNPSDGSKSTIAGYLQVKKGSTYNSIYSVLPQETKVPIKPYVKNVNGFDRLLISTNAYGVLAEAVADTVNFQPDVYVDKGEKLYVQMLKNNKYTYNFFDIPTGTLGLDIDLNKVTKPAVLRTITSPVSNFGFELYAKNDKNHFDAYLLGIQSSITDKIILACPTESFKEYETYSGYATGGFNYNFATSGPSIPTQVPTWDATFNVTGTTLSTFVPSISGTFDYYHASFENKTGFGLKIELYSPSAGNYTQLKFPGFGKFLNTTGLLLGNQKLISFELDQIQGFDEKVFNYRPVEAIRSTPDFNARSVRKTY